MDIQGDETVNYLKDLRIKARKVLDLKKKTLLQLEEQINHLIDGINRLVMLQHKLELEGKLKLEFIEKSEEAQIVTMKVAIRVFEEYCHMMAAKGVITEPAVGIPEEDTEAVYYAYVEDFCNHRVERDPKVIEERLSVRYPSVKANPPDIIKRLAKAGRRLDQNLKLNEELKLMQKTFYGGEARVDTPRFAFGELEKRKWGVASFINIHCRPSMEDTHFVGKFSVKPEQEAATEVYMYGVFDGHGGSVCSTFLQENLPQLIKMYLENVKDLSDLNVYNAIKLAFVEAHERFLKLKDRSGATALVCLEIKDSLWCANVGDTRAVLSNSGHAVQLTEDQKPTTEGICQGIYRRGGRVVGGRIDMPTGSLGPGRAIGDKNFKGVNPRPKLTKIPLSDFKKGSRLILACDGLWDVVGSARAVSLIKKAPDIESALKVLQDEAINLWTADNVTILMIEPKSL